MLNQNVFIRFHPQLPLLNGKRDIPKNILILLCCIVYHFLCHPYSGNEMENALIILTGFYLLETIAYLLFSNVWQVLSLIFMSVLRLRTHSLKNVIEKELSWMKGQVSVCWLFEFSCCCLPVLKGVKSKHLQLWLYKLQKTSGSSFVFMFALSDLIQQLIQPYFSTKDQN